MGGDGLGWLDRGLQVDCVLLLRFSGDELSGCFPMISVFSGSGSWLGFIYGAGGSLMETAAIQAGRT